MNREKHIRKSTLAFALALLLTVANCAVAQVANAPLVAHKARIVDAYGKLPLSFEANEGQTERSVKFLSRGNGYALFLTANEAVLTLRNPARHNPRGAGFQPAQRAAETTARHTQRDAVLRIKLVGANAAPEITGLDELPGKSNYFLGNDPAKWRTNVPHHAKVHYKDIYPGIDLVYYGNQRQLEYDFVVAPGRDPRAIAFALVGVRKVELDARGDLAVETEDGGQVRLRKPVAYQEASGARQLVPASFVLRSEHQAGFEVGAYDRQRPLVIDPTIVPNYSTFLGGAASGDIGLGIAVDNSGNAYITGFTQPYSPGTTWSFPTTPGALRTTYAGCTPDFFGMEDFADVFVTKLNASGTALLYSTYLGGGGVGFQCGDYAFGIAVNSAGEAWVTGQTSSPSFPTTANAYQTSFSPTCAIPSSSRCEEAAFVTKLNADGNGLLYSTYLHDTVTDFRNLDLGFGIALDSLGYAYVVGMAASPTFPTTANAYQTLLPGCASAYGAHAFVTKLDASQSGAASLLYSTYLAGCTGDRGSGIAVDPTATGVVWVTGATLSADFPVKPNPGAYQITNHGGWDAFVSKLDTTLIGSASLLYSTYLGGSSQDGAGSSAAGDRDRLGGWGAIAVDTAGDAYVTGATISADFPTTLTAYSRTFHFDPSIGTQGDGFVAKLHPGGLGSADLIYSTYLGGTDADNPAGIGVDSSGNAYVVGATCSGNFPTTPYAFQPVSPDGSGCFAFNGFVTIEIHNGFLTELNPTGTVLLYSTYLGGGSVDSGNAIALDSASPPGIYLTGSTGSLDFPVTPGVYQGTLSNPLSPERDAFVTKMSLQPQADLSVTKTASPDPVIGGGKVTYTIVVRNNGPDDATGVTLTDPIPSGGVYVSSSITQGSCSLSSGTLTCLLGSLANSATATVTLVVKSVPDFLFNPITNQWIPYGLTNTASVTGSPDDVKTADNRATQTTRGSLGADLSLAKTCSGANVTPPCTVPTGKEFNYTIVATNNCCMDVTNVTVSDPLPSALTFVARHSSPSCAKGKGTTTITCTIPSLARHTSTSFTIAVKAPHTAGSAVNTASVSATEADGDTSNNSSSVTTTFIK